MALWSHIGSWGTPEFGATEWLQKKLWPQKAYAASGGSNILGATTYQPAPKQEPMVTTVWGEVIPESLVPTPSTGGGGISVSPQQTSTTGTSQQPTTSGGGASTPQPPAPPEPTYSGPSLEDILSEVEAAYSNFEKSLRETTESQIGQLKELAKAEKETVTGKEKRDIEAYELERGIEEKGKKSALAEAAREYSELSAGLGARYGARSGAGRAALGILGSAAMRARAKVRTAYQNTIDKINKAIADTRAWAADQLRTIDTNLNVGIQQLQTALQSKLAEAAQAKAATRANLSMQAWQDYQNQVARLKEQAYNLQQQVYLKMIDHQTALKEMATKARTTYRTVAPKPFTLNYGQARYIPKAGGGYEMIAAPAKPEEQELWQIKQQVGQEAAKAGSEEEAAAYIRSQGFNPEDFGYYEY